jgi:chromosome segregation ATPase
LYETVRADRNVYSKNLIESQDEISEMKRKVKIMNHQVDQLKEEIASKETVLVKEHFEHAKLEKEKDCLSSQISKLQQQLDESSQLIQNQKAEENKLRHIILEADSDRLRQKKEYDSVIHERVFCLIIYRIFLVHS